MYYNRILGVCPESEKTDGSKRPSVFCFRRDEHDIIDVSGF